MNYLRNILSVVSITAVVMLGVLAPANAALSDVSTTINSVCMQPRQQGVQTRTVVFTASFTNTGSTTQTVDVVNATVGSNNTTAQSFVVQDGVATFDVLPGETASKTFLVSDSANLLNKGISVNYTVDGQVGRLIYNNSGQIPSC